MGVKEEKMGVHQEEGMGLFVVLPYHHTVITFFISKHQINR